MLRRNDQPDLNAELSYQQAQPACMHQTCAPFVLAPITMRIQRPLFPGKKKQESLLQLRTLPAGLLGDLF